MGLEAFPHSAFTSSEPAAEKKLSKATCLFLESRLFIESYWKSERPLTKCFVFFIPAAYCSLYVGYAKGPRIGNLVPGRY